MHPGEAMDYPEIDALPSYRKLSKISNKNLAMPQKREPDPIIKTEGRLVEDPLDDFGHHFVNDDTETNDHDNDIAAKSSSAINAKVRATGKVFQADRIACPLCKKEIVSYRDNFKKHFSRKHPDEVIDETFLESLKQNETQICPVCGKEIIFDNMKHHMENIHDIGKGNVSLCYDFLFIDLISYNISDFIVH